MKRELQTILSLLLLLLVVSSVEAKRRPNLLIIQTDEHNFRTLGCYREIMSEEQAYIWGPGVEVKTPNIDRIANEGALFTSCYASSPVCSPSRASFVSGMYPQNTGVPSNNYSMNESIETFAKTLSDSGYKTSYVGKWHLDGDGKPQWHPERKFGFEDNTYMFNRGHWKSLTDGENGPEVLSRKGGVPNYGLDGADEIHFATDFLVNKAIEDIKESGDTPFVCLVAIPDPHGPNSVRAPYDTMYTDLKFQKPKSASKSKEGVPSWAVPVTPKHNTISDYGMAQYFGMVKCIDDNVGKIIAVLEEEGKLDNTIVIFTSDHGDLLGEHGRDNKGNPLEASAKIPFVIRYPKEIDAKLIIENSMVTTDFTPGILSLMGVDSDIEYDGDDFSMLFSRRGRESWREVSIIRSTTKREIKRDSGWITAVTDRYKLTYSASKGDSPWFTDLDSDPDELVNSFNDPKYIDIIEELSKSIKRYGIDTNDRLIDQEQISKYLR